MKFWQKHQWDELHKNILKSPPEDIVNAIIEGSGFSFETNTELIKKVGNWMNIAAIFINVVERPNDDIEAFIKQLKPYVIEDDLTKGIVATMLQSVQNQNYLITQETKYKWSQLTSWMNGNNLELTPIGEWSM